MSEHRAYGPDPWGGLPHTEETKLIEQHPEFVFEKQRSMSELLTEDELVLLTDQWEEEYNHCEMTDAEWQMKRWRLIAQAQLDKIAQLKVDPDREDLQRLWCQHCKALQKTNETVVECWYNPLEHGKENAFCQANCDAIDSILALLPDIRKEERQRICQEIEKCASWTHISYLIEDLKETHE